MPQSEFLDRADELRALEGLWAKKAAQLVVMYGRRRVGKTELLSRFCRGKRAYYFVATQTKSLENLRAFVRLLRTDFKHPILAEGVVPTWEALLNALADEAKKKTVLVVLDEFQYLGKDDKE